MSDTDPVTPENQDESDPNESLPEGVPAPPMPKPDLHNIIEEGPTYKTENEKDRKRKRKKKSSQHPLDRVAAPGTPAPGSKKSCCACGGCALLVIVLLIGALIGGVAWFGPGRFAKEGYEVVQFETAREIVQTAPDSPTLYVGQEIIYEAPSTEVPIAIIGSEITISGDFLESVSLTGAKVTATPEARFAKDLELYALEFKDEGLTLNGSLKGRVMQNSQ